MAVLGVSMKRFIAGEDRSQSTLFPERLDDYIAEDSPVRVVDVFVDELDLKEVGFDGIEPEITGRPAYHPATLLKIYVYGYLNRIQSSRRLERETPAIGVRVQSPSAAELSAVGIAASQRASGSPTPQLNARSPAPNQPSAARVRSPRPDEFPSSRGTYPERRHQ
jgi:hypothetical protein